MVFSNLECAKRYPEIYDQIQQHMEENEGKAPETLEQAFGMWLEWNGIIGWTETILDVVEAMKQCEVE